MNKERLITVFQTTILLIGLIIALPYDDVRASEKTMQQTLLILGDSLSAGYGITQGSNWTDLLQQQLNAQEKNIRLVNASISGDTTANGLNRLPDALKQFHPDIVLIELGANDGLRGLSLQHIKANLTQLIELSEQAGARVLLMTIHIPPNYGKKYTQAFRQIYHDLALQHSLPQLPFLLKGIALKPELMQRDGLHPNKKAQPKIAEAMWKSLETLL